MKRKLNLKIKTTMTMMEIQFEKRATKFFFFVQFFLVLNANVIYNVRN